MLIFRNLAPKIGQFGICTDLPAAVVRVARTPDAQVRYPVELDRRFCESDYH